MSSKWYFQLLGTILFLACKKTHYRATNSLMNMYGKNFASDFHLWYTSRDISTCEERWRLMKKKYYIEEEQDNWLLKMYRLRGYWVNDYLKNIFCAVKTTIQRSESINSFFDGFVNVNICTSNSYEIQISRKLVEFVHQYDKTVAARRRSESQEDFRCLNCVPNCTSNSYEIQVSRFYTRKIFLKHFCCFKRNGQS